MFRQLSPPPVLYVPPYRKYIYIYICIITGCDEAECVGRRCSATLLLLLSVVILFFPYRIYIYIHISPVVTKQIPLAMECLSRAPDEDAGQDNEEGGPNHVLVISDCNGRCDFVSCSNRVTGLGLVFFGLGLGLSEGMT